MADVVIIMALSTRISIPNSYGEEICEVNDIISVLFLVSKARENIKLKPDIVDKNSKGFS